MNALDSTRDALLIEQLQQSVDQKQTELDLMREAISALIRKAEPVYNTAPELSVPEHSKHWHKHWHQVAWEMSHDGQLPTEIARVLGKPRNTVKQFIRRRRAKIAAEGAT